MNKRDVPGRLINEPEQFDIFFSKVPLLSNLEEQCGVVVLLLHSAQVTWTKPVSMGFVVIRGLPELQRCVWRGKGGEWEAADYPQLSSLL